MKSLFYIVGAGDVGKGLPLIPKEAAVIAADGGLRHLEKAGIRPDLTLGDFDSYGKIPEGDNVFPCKPEKDDTDMMLAVKEALGRGASSIVLCGGLGGRFDHSIANVQTLAYIAEHGCMGFLVGEGTVCCVVKNGAIRFPQGLSGYVSAFCLGDAALGVDIKGLKYPLRGARLSMSVPLGVSNEFVSGGGEISVKDGSLLVIWQDESFLPGKYTITK